MIDSTRPARLTLAAALAVSALAVVPRPAWAAYNCKGDKKIEVPMRFSITAESAGRIHVSGYGGSDKSGSIVPVGWRLYDGSGKLIDTFPKADLGFARWEMLQQTNLEGLAPGGSYTVELLSQDWCGNQGSYKQSGTMPESSSEGVAPVVSTPALVRTGFQTAQFTTIQFSLTDNTGVQKVSVLIDGASVAEYNYFDGRTFRWWCDPYTQDSVQSTLEGPNYYVYYADTYKGRYAYVEVVAIDLFGNRTVSGAWLSL